jgi:23S rRNA (cytidine2498-2'-O)-methyltransferase
MTARPAFLFVTCQLGAEGAVKGEFARRWPDFRFAFSRPGFLTFKLPEGHRLAADFGLGSVFARSYGFSLGKVSGTDPDTLAREVWRLLSDRPVSRLHVWPRDEFPPGQHGAEPSLAPIADEARKAVLRQCPRGVSLAEGADDPRQPARRGDLVLDGIVVEPQQWWVGCHRADSVPSRWPGGIIPLTMPPHAVSRAWLKMEEALQWSQLPIPQGARWVELGSAPGGASQAMLDRGFEVTGVDPAAMDPKVLEHPRFQHIRRRVAAVRRRDLRKVRWLTADMNVAPNYTLDAVESIVTHPEISVRGMLLTLKLIEWELAEQLPDYLRRIRRWGYNLIRARQLFYNRQEVCVAALQRPFVRKGKCLRQR